MTRIKTISISSLRKRSDFQNTARKANSFTGQNIDRVKDREISLDLPRKQRKFRASDQQTPCPSLFHFLTKPG